jgi:tRNA(Ile2)-agmatinylcytidine synthase
MTYDLIGLPRLVRLNPNVPWKTRGNGAIALQVGIGTGKKQFIGELDHKKIFCYQHKKQEADSNTLQELVDKIIRKYMQHDAQPAYILSRYKPPYVCYKKTVKFVAIKKEIEKHISHFAQYRGYNGGRGIIGATAAISWTPYDKTYELITYGKEKWIDEKSVIDMDKKCVLTFNNYDYRNKYIALLPKAASPVFYGIRGESIEEVLRAKTLLKTAPVQRWIIFMTNQGTDDHLIRKKISEIRPYNSVIVKGVVKNIPFTKKGGHMIFTIDDGCEIDCAAYEPTKEFRDIIGLLAPGDEVLVYGGVRKNPCAINIEKIRIIRLSSIYKKIENPLCTICKKHMKSMGYKKGYRCVNCRKKTHEENAKIIKIKRQLQPGMYEAPVIARRHLAKPIKRMHQRLSKKKQG